MGQILPKFSKIKFQKITPNFPPPKSRQKITPKNHATLSLLSARNPAPKIITLFFTL
jgi:hypothetical protein